MRRSVLIGVCVAAGIGFWGGVLGLARMGDQATETEAQEYLEAGKAAGYDAAVLAQTAETPEEWEAVEAGWSEAISALRDVEYDTEAYDEAQTKIDEYEDNRDAAKAQLEQALAASGAPTGSTALTNFEGYLSPEDPNGRYVASAELGSSDDTLVLIMTAGYDGLPAAQRQQVATALWQIWAGLRSSEALGDAYVRLMDGSGAHVGGSRPGNGSEIWVEE